MSEASSASLARPEDLNFVYLSSGPNYEYQVGSLLVGDEPARRSIAVIFVSAFEDRVIVALPQKAWDRRVAKRKMPSEPFTKPLLVEIAAAVPEDREQQADFTLRVWIGALTKAFADTVTFADLPEVWDVPFAASGGVLALPYAPALIQLADSHFSFVTAPPGDAFEIRMKNLESSVGEIASALRALTSASAAKPAVPKAASVGATRAAKPKARPLEGSIPGTPPPMKNQATELPTFDPALALIARESGLPASELAEIREAVVGVA